METTKNSRLPNLAIAILEAKVETIIGKDAIKELKALLQNKELRDNLLQITQKAESRFLRVYPEKDIVDVLKELPLADLPSMQTAVINFYDRPTTPDTFQELESQFKAILSTRYPSEHIAKAASLYILYLWEEATGIPEIREQLTALATIRTERGIVQMNETLIAIQEKLVASSKVKYRRTPNRRVGKEPYTTSASSKTPGLILFLIDAGYLMNKDLNGLPATKYIFENLTAILRRLLARSTRGQVIVPRYHIGCYLYNSKIYDIWGGIRPIDEAIKEANKTLSSLSISNEPGNTYEALSYIEDVLQTHISKYLDCPTPLVCHITAGEYPGKNPISVAQRIMSLKWCWCMKGLTKEA